MNFGPQISSYEGKTIGLYGGKFLPFHRGHLKCILEAQSLVDVLFVVIGFDEEYEKELCKDAAFGYVTPKQRERWITEELRDFKNIRVLSQYERRSDDYMNDPAVTESYQELLGKIGGRVDKVFSSETEYTPYFEKQLPGAEHVVLDEGREFFNVSATKIRAMGVHKAWHYLPDSVRSHYVKRVCLCGIESVGKSHNARMAAKLFRTTYISEYGRDYYEILNGYEDLSDPNDYNEIAAGHIYLLNQQTKHSNQVALMDTDLIYTQYFNRLEGIPDNPIIDSVIRSGSEKIDLYIYIEPHNGHELDGTRRPIDDEGRIQRNQMLKDMYAEYGKELVIIDEVDRNKRFHKIVLAIQELIK